MYNITTGNIFSNWTVLEDRVKGNTKVLCECSCGTERYVNIANLIKGLSTGCGCQMKQTLRELKINSLIGQKFNRLTVIEDTGKRINGAVVWLCKCDCGNYTESISGNLRRSHKSCGCLNSEVVIKRNKESSKHGKYKTREYKQTVSNKRREMKRSLDSLWTIEMEETLRKLQPNCVVCGKSGSLHTDHVKPLSKGFGLIPGNAVRLCINCNSSKKERSLEILPEEWKNKIKLAAYQFNFVWEIYTRICV